MCAVKRKASRRISVWTLIFALLLALESSFSVFARAENMLNDAQQAVRDGSEEAEHAAREASDDADDKKQDGEVQDGDGILGNEQEEEQNANRWENGIKVGWVGVVIALVAVVAVIVLIVVLVPKKKNL